MGSEEAIERELSLGERSNESLRIIKKLSEAGFVAYLAGGCVRDALLKRRPKDFDVATNATPDSVRELFGKRRTLAFGASFGVIGVLPGDRSTQAESADEILPTEVATFRSDGEYSDGRRPDSVQYGDAREDAQRRDFTINGMFYDPLSQQVIDYVGGFKDLECETIRTIGNASDRFGEDKLRMLRAVRFATTLGFAVEDATMRAIRKYAADITMVSGERIGTEMRKTIASANGPLGLRLLSESGLAPHVLPELTELYDEELVACFGQLPTIRFESAMALVFIIHDVHPTKLNEVVSRWKLSNEESRRIGTCINRWSILANEKGDLKWSEIQPVLIDRDADYVLDVATAIVHGRRSETAGVQRAQDALNWPASRLNPIPLLTGDDLITAGIKPGPAFSAVLSRIRAAQLDGEIDSTQKALELARALMDNKSG